MQRKKWTSKLALLLLFVSSVIQAGVPLWTFAPQTATSVVVGPGEIATVTYRVTNQSSKPHTLTMQSIPGISQVTSSGFCSNPFALQGKGSCLLSLQIGGSQLKGGISGGPIVCQQGATNQCYQPSAANILQVAIGPSIQSINPNSGIALGGTGVTITGQELSGTTSVTFGGTAAASYAVVNNTSVTAVTPAHSEGVVDVILTTPVGTATIPFTYTGLSVTQVNPGLGGPGGGTPITITGTGLTGTTAVTFFEGATAVGGATGITNVDETTVKATTTAYTGTSTPPVDVDVQVTATLGTATLSDGFEYASQTVTSVDPAFGTSLGGTPITITGTGLTGATDIAFFEGAAEVGGATILTVTDTVITATTTAYTGTTALPVDVDVQVTAKLGTATLSNGFEYASSTLVISPTSGTAAGYETVTLSRGTGLDNVADVTFDGTSVINLNPPVPVDDFSVAVVTPPGNAGTVPVVISFSDSSPDVSIDYTYIATAIGESSSGGTIGCLNSGDEDFVIATANASDYLFWGNNQTTGATDPTNGYGNTQTIVSVYTSSDSYAAGLCNLYTIDSNNVESFTGACADVNAYCYTGWFLPASEQLKCIYNNNAVLLVPVDNYWSSRENTSSSAYFINLSNGTVDSTTKTGTLRVRCARNIGANV